MFWLLFFRCAIIYSAYMAEKNDYCPIFRAHTRKCEIILVGVSSCVCVWERLVCHLIFCYYKEEKNTNKRILFLFFLFLSEWVEGIINNMTYILMMGRRLQAETFRRVERERESERESGREFKSPAIHCIGHTWKGCKLEKKVRIEYSNFSLNFQFLVELSYFWGKKLLRISIFLISGPEWIAHPFTQNTDGDETLSPIGKVEIDSESQNMTLSLISPLSDNNSLAYREIDG